MKEDWTYKKLGEVCEIICGQDYKTVQDDNGAYPIYGTGGIMGYVSQYRCPSNSVIIGRKGNINNPLFVEQPFWNVDTAFGVVPKTTHLIPKYFFYFCKGYDFTKHDVSVTIPSLRRTDILKIQVPVPSLETQSQIVSELDLLQSIIDKQKAQQKELDNLAQAVFFDIFGDPVENNKKWDKKRIDEIGEIVSGSTPSTTDESNWNGDVNWITPAEMGVQLYCGETQRKITQKAAKSLTLMPVGTVLLSSRAPIGKLAISTVPMCCNQGFKNIICGKSINNIFMYYYLMLTMDNVIALGRGATFKEVSKQGISAYNVIVPPLPLQQSFAAKIESIEKQKAAINKSIEESQKLFDYTMDKYFG